MSEVPNSTPDELTCRIFGCGKNCAEGWKLCEEHVEADVAQRACSHGNDGRPCIECLAESLRAEAVTTPHAVPENELLALTARFDTHPEGWGWPCMCGDCRSYCDG